MGMFDWVGDLGSAFIPDSNNPIYKATTHIITEAEDVVKIVLKTGLGKIIPAILPGGGGDAPPDDGSSDFLSSPLFIAGLLLVAVLLIN